MSTIAGKVMGNLMNGFIPLTVVVLNRILERWVVYFNYGVSGNSQIFKFAYLPIRTFLTALQRVGMRNVLSVAIYWEL